MTQKNIIVTKPIYKKTKAVVNTCNTRTNNVTKFYVEFSSELKQRYWHHNTLPIFRKSNFHYTAFSSKITVSPGNSLVSSWCDRSILASLLRRCLTRALKTCLEARTCLENENPCLEKSGSVLQFLQAYLCSFT